jgi:3',5'-cyclic AMP phosphodiesterase CpdA
MLIAHFSDVHALSLHGVGPLQFINKRIAGYANLRIRRRDKHPVRLFESMVADLNRHPLDEIVVSGDLTNLSLAPEFDLARAILDRLGLGPEHVTLVPGNHDVYTLSALKARLFQRVLGPYARSDGAVEVSFPSVRVRGELAIVGVSTALPSPVPFADGWVGKRQLAELEQRLISLTGRFRVLVLHHPPYKNRHSILRGLRDRGRLQALLRRVGCELVLHGHEHRDLRSELSGPNGPIPIVGVGSGTYDDPRPDRRARYNVYRIEGRRLVSIETRVHDAATDTFIPLAS